MAQRFKKLGIPMIILDDWSEFHDLDLCEDVYASDLERLQTFFHLLNSNFLFLNNERCYLCAKRLAKISHNKSSKLMLFLNKDIKPKELMIWQNKPNDLEQSFLYLQDPTASHKISHNNFNYGVRRRFAFALNALNLNTFVYLDDDTNSRC